jgi:hypothetical protein
LRFFSENSGIGITPKFTIFNLMKPSTLLTVFIILALQLQAQNNELYSALVRKADSLYNAKDYKNSAYTYSEAFKAGGWKAATNDRYNAACSWALARVPDSAFFNLYRITEKGGYNNLNHITTDPDLESLHKDKRWKPLIEKIKANKDKAEEGLDKVLVARLDSIYTEDQKYRMQMSSIADKHGWDSKEMQELWKVANRADSINLIKVLAILDKYGWLGPDVVGQQGNSTLFLVIQHSDQKTQEKYLPMMREAVKNKKAQASSLALLEDRVALGQGKKQIYGSQIGMQAGTNKNYILPLEDPDNVDKRRAEVGLGPLSEYVSRWKIVWDPEQYKKELPQGQGLQFTFLDKNSKKPLANEKIDVKVVDTNKSTDTTVYTVSTNVEGVMEKLTVPPGNKNIWIRRQGCEFIVLMDIMIGESSYFGFPLSLECVTKEKEDKKKNK